MILAMWTGHTDRSRVLAQRLHDVLKAKGQDKAAAASMRIGAAQLSRQLAGVESFSLWRFAELPDDVKAAFYEAEITAMGGRVLWRSDLELITGFCNMPKRQMAKMRVVLPLGSQPRQEIA